MSIRSINYNINASYGAYNQKLTASTKKELEEAGIPYNPNMTESEGKKLLAGAKSSNGQGALKNEQNYSKNGLFLNDEKDSLKERAIELARQLGVSVNEDMPLQQILTLIEQALEQRIAVSQNDIDEIKKLREFSSELANIQAQANGSMGFDNTNQALMMSLEMLSEYNKNFLYR